MRIVEITEFSAGICGVWTRVLGESEEFSRLGHEVLVLSSNVEKGSDRIASSDEKIGRIEIKRMKSKQGYFDKFLSKNVTYFDFEKELVAFKPDLVITHLLHPHSFKAVRICNKLKVPCYLVTHAPFNVRRRFPLNVATWAFNQLNRTKLSKFTRIISITKWEEPFLKKLGVRSDRISYIPNGLPDEFFKQKRGKPFKEVLFLGRIAPVKDVETLIRAAKLLPKINFEIVGSAEEEYLKLLRGLMDKLNVKNVKIIPPVYDLKKKIKLIDEHKIFVLPSKREAMPQALLEAMARGKTVISSRTDGGMELVNGKNGLLFGTEDYVDFARLIGKNIRGNLKMEKEAIKTAEKFSWKRLIHKYQELFRIDVK